MGIYVKVGRILIRSMTGFGKAQLVTEKREINVEVKSVNNRYLDVNFKMPRFLNFAEENIKIPENAIVINCTSIGLKDGDLPILDFSKVPQSAVFFDMPYRRGEQTNSVKSATKYGIKAQSGLSMLAWQGAKSLSIWTNHNFEDIAKTMYTTLGL